MGTQPTTEVRAGTIDRGWRQGAVVPAAYLNGERGNIRNVAELTDDCLHVILSHSCDVLHGGFDSEPGLELLIARPVPPERHDAATIDGKHVRLYQFRLEDQTYQIAIGEKSIVDRRLLADREAPTLHLPTDLTKKIAAWAGKRYTRPAFPFAFDKRRNPAVKKMARAAKRSADLISGVFVRLSTSEELTDGEDYHMSMIVTVPDTTFDEGDNERKAHAFAAELESELAQCTGIVVDRTDLVSDMKFPIGLLRVWQKYDFDHFSYAEDPQGEAAVRAV